MDPLDRITIDPKICLGQATIRGMRITVSIILKMLAAGQSTADILRAYPELEEADIRQAMQYAAWLASDQLHLLRTACVVNFLEDVPVDKDIAREGRRGFPDMAAFRESLGVSPYPGNTILEMREE